MTKPNWVDNLQLEGRKAVLEALNHNKPIDKLLIRKEEDGAPAGTLRMIAAKARQNGIAVQLVARAKLDNLTQSGNHQGVIAICPSKEYVEIADILAIAKERREEPFVLVLDGITDPHNLGAILRTAEAAGVHGVIIPKHRSATITGVVAKTSAGAIEHIAVAKATNISRAAEELKAAGLWLTCAAGADKPPDSNQPPDAKDASRAADAAPAGSHAAGYAKKPTAKPTDLYEADLRGPMGLVIGAEGDGVSRLVREKCDFVVAIPMFGHISSLNASVAAGVLLYEIVRARKFP